MAIEASLNTSRERTRLGDVVYLGSTEKTRRYWVVGSPPLEGDWVLLFPVMSNSLGEDIQIANQGSTIPVREVLEKPLITRLPLEMLRQGARAYALANFSPHLLKAALSGDMPLPFRTRIPHPTI